MERRYPTEDGQTAFDAALAQAIFEIDALHSQLSATVFFARIRQIVLAGISNEQYSRQTAEVALQIHQEVMITVLAMRDKFDPKETLDDFPMDS